MMFMTPIPPTSNEIAAMPASRTVRVRSVDVAVVSSDCWLLMVKSAVVTVFPWVDSKALLASWYAAESASVDVASM